MEYKGNDNFLKNNKAFTLVEMIAVVIILGLLIAVGIPAISRQLGLFRNDYYKKLENTVKSGGQEYLMDKKYDRPTKILYSKVIKVSELENKGYIDEVKDYLGKKCDDSDSSYSYFIAVKVDDKKYEYAACLKCSNDKYVTDTSKAERNLCDEAWLTNDGISYNRSVESDEFIYVYYGSSEREIKEQVGIKYSIMKKDASGAVLDEVTNSRKGEDDIIYPDNINELVGKNVNNTVTLNYKLPNGTTIQKKAVIYKHNSPLVTMTYGSDNVSSGMKKDNIYNGNSEWTNNLNIGIRFANSDNADIKKIINIKNVQYYNTDTASWEDTNCTLSSDKKSCTWNINKNFMKNVRFRIVNDRDQISDETSNYPVKVDASAPSCPTSVGDRTWAKSKAITVTCNDNNSINSGCTKDRLILSYPNNTKKNCKTDNVKLYDNAGNVSSCSVDVFVDSTPPTTCSLTAKVGINDVTNGQTVEDDVTFKVKGVDSEKDDSGIASAKAMVKRVGSSSERELTSTEYLADGTYNVTPVCTDNAGNVKKGTTLNFTLKKEKTYTLSFKVEGSDSYDNPAPVKVKENAYPPAITPPKRDNYIFNGYYYCEGSRCVGNYYYDGAGYATNKWDLKKDATLIPSWSKCETEIAYSTSKAKSMLCTCNGQTVGKTYTDNGNNLRIDVDTKIESYTGGSGSKKTPTTVTGSCVFDIDTIETPVIVKYFGFQKFGSSPVTKCGTSYKHAYSFGVKIVNGSINIRSYLLYKGEYKLYNPSLQESKGKYGCYYMNPSTFSLYTDYSDDDATAYVCNNNGYCATAIGGPSK